MTQQRAAGQKRQKGRKMNEIKEKMRATVAKQTTKNLYAIARAIGNQSESAVATARYFVLSEIESRCGAEAVDVLMDELGL